MAVLRATRRGRRAAREAPALRPLSRNSRTACFPLSARSHARRGAQGGGGRDGDSDSSGCAPDGDAEGAAHGRGGAAGDDGATGWEFDIIEDDGSEASATTDGAIGGEFHAQRLVSTGALMGRKKPPPPPAPDESVSGRTYDEITKSPPPHLRYSRAVGAFVDIQQMEC